MFGVKFICTEVLYDVVFDDSDRSEDDNYYYHHHHHHGQGVMLLCVCVCVGVYIILNTLCVTCCAFICAVFYMINTREKTIKKTN